MLEFDILQSGLALLLLLAAGDVLARLFKGAVPAILFAGIGYALCCWIGVLPGDLAVRAGVTTLAPIGMMLVIVHMGASMSLSEFAANWRVVALSAVTFAGQVLALFLVVGSVYGVNTAVGGLPGGMATALMVQERARGLGYDQLVVLSVLLLTTQSLVGSPIAAWCIRREARRLRDLPHPREAETGTAAREKAAEPPGSALQYGALLRLYATAWAAARLEAATGLSRYVLCLLLGLLLARLGLLGKNELAASKSDGFIFFLLMCTVISGFSAATPQMFAQMLLPLLLVLATEVASVVCVSLIAGRFLGLSPYMSAAIGMNIMIGFPLNMLVSQEIIHQLTEDAEERARLMSQIAGRMVIGGMVSTTFLATVSAGIFVGLMR